MNIIRSILNRKQRGRNKRGIYYLLYVIYLLMLTLAISEMILSFFPYDLPSHTTSLLSTNLKNKINSELYYCEDRKFCRADQFYRLFKDPTDKKGFNNVKNYHSNSKSIPIITIGDSYTYGGRVQTNFPRKLEELIGKPVLNLGLPGGSPQTAHEALKRYGIIKQPKIVLFGLYLGNDLYDLTVYESLGGDPFFNHEYINPPILDSFGIKKLVEILRFYSNVFSIIWEIAQPKKGKKTKTPGDFLVTIKNKKKNFLDVTWVSGYPGFLGHEKPFVTLTKILGDMKKTVKSVNGELIIAIIPAPNEFYFQYINSGFPGQVKLNSSIAKEEHDFTMKRLDRICAQLSLHCKNILPELLENFEYSSNLYYDTGEHFTEEGYKVWASIIYRYLKDLGLINNLVTSEN